SQCASAPSEVVSHDSRSSSRNICFEIEQEIVSEGLLPLGSVQFIPNPSATFIPPNALNLRSFRKVVKNLEELHPEISRDNILDALVETKENKGLFSGLPLSTIVEMTSSLLKKKFALKSEGKNRIEKQADDHQVYYCGQESFRRNGVAFIVDKRIGKAVLGYNLQNDRMISVRIQGKPFSITVVQVYAPTTGAEEAEVDRFYEGLQHLLELTPKNDVLIIMGDWNAKVRSQKVTGITGKFGLGVQNEAGHRLAEFCQENTMVIANTFPTTQEMTLHMDITRRLKLKKVGKSTRPLRYDLNHIPDEYTVEVTNIFKELDLIDRVPEKLWTEVHNIVQEVATKTIPKKKKCKKAKWLSEEALQIVEERREAKGKGERYTQLNAEFQRIARRDNAFLNEQCREIEENNRIGRTRDLFKKIGDMKGMFHANMGMLVAEHIMRKAGLDESQVGIKIAGRNNLRYADDTTLMAESEEELKSLLMWVKEENAKAGLKLNIKKTKIMASCPLTFWQIDGQEMETKVGKVSEERVLESKRVEEEWMALK
ncbi:Craniofacial development protein 2, partial [Varanus komodoensis]